MNGGPLELTASEADAGRRLDQFLAEPLGSRTHAQALIDGGQVRVDGARDRSAMCCAAVRW